MLMLKTENTSGWLCVAVVCCLNSAVAFAQSPFIDQVPSRNDSTSIKQDFSLELKTGVRVVMRSNLGVVVRGEMLSISKNGPTIVTDRARIRSPEGVEYKFSTLQSLNIAEHELHWSKGKDAEEFLKEVSASETIEFENLKEFQTATMNTPDETVAETNSDGNTGNGTANSSSNGKVIRMQPATKQPIERPTITIICGNCEKEVSLSSDSGQECPHCNILWDQSPLDAAAIASLKASEDAADAENARNSFDPETGQFISPSPDTGKSKPQNTTAQNNTNQTLQPVAAPAPIQAQSQPHEITIENLPLWLKFTVFGICFGMMYYAIFVR
ncbi:hypothetical protein OAF42_00975 [Planctomicrobium sp.]|jgi:hypothetical protein|nr:hypothetical protein [Planctomicrobium sp.]